jgi:hypothetical protein
MTTQTTSTQYIGGATEKKDQPEWTDSRPITCLSSHQFMDSYLAATLCGGVCLSCEARGDLYGSQNCPAYRSWCGSANIARYRLLSRTWHLCVGDAMSNRISRRQPHVLKKRSVAWTGTHTHQETRVGVPNLSKQRWN